MRLTLADSAALNLIRGYSREELRVGQRVFASTLLVGPRLLVDDFAATTPAEITEADVERIAQVATEVLLVGWAGGQTFLSREQRRWFAERRMAVEVMELGAACRTYNVLVSDGREPLALLFPGRDT